MSGCFKATGVWLRRLVTEAVPERRAAPLAKLRIGKTAIGDAGLAAVAEAFPQLQELDLPWNDLATDRSFPALARLAHLRALRAQRCKRIFEPGVAELLLAAPALCELDLRLGSINRKRLFRAAPPSKWANGAEVSLLL